MSCLTAKRVNLQTNVGHLNSISIVFLYLILAGFITSCAEETDLNIAKPDTQYVVTATAGVGGSITPTRITVKPGDQAQFTIVAEANYRIENVSGCGAGSLANGVYTTAAITSDCEVSASFIADTSSITITTSVGVGGSLSPETTTVTLGSRAEFVVTPDPHYQIRRVFGCNGQMINNDTYRTGVITAPCQVVARFRLQQFNVNAVAGSGGTIAPMAIIVDYGATTSFTVTPDIDYMIDVVSGCGGSLTAAAAGAPATYQTAAVIADCVVNASFAPASVTQFAIASNVVGGGGIVTPTSIDIVLGNRATFNLQPDSNFRVASVTGCKGNLTNNTYTTGVVNSGCQVEVSFIAYTSGTLQTVNTLLSTGGDVSPNAVRLLEGDRATFSVTANAGYQLASVRGNGCDGNLNGNSYQTQDISNDCTLSIDFTATAALAAFAMTNSSASLIEMVPSFTFYAQAENGGSISPQIAQVLEGGYIEFVVSPQFGFVIDTVSGCGGFLSGNVFTSAVAQAGYNECNVKAQFKSLFP